MGILSLVCYYNAVALSMALFFKGRTVDGEEDTSLSSSSSGYFFLFFLCSSPVGAQLLLATQHTHALILPSLYIILCYSLRFFDRKLALFIQLQQTPPTSNSVTKFD
jgi:hypothetical protein